jgi:glutamate formiminotransferase/formiminotetrahydrofolate cyclodeaminase
MTDWLSALAAPTPSPAGGSAAAIAGAMAAALAEMVAGLTGAREKYRAVHFEAADVVARSERLRGHLALLAARDAEVFAAFSAALALPRETPQERAVRERAKADAFQAGAAVQLELLDGLAESATLAGSMAERGLASALGDAATAVLLAGGAARSAYWAVRSNLQGAADHDAAERQVARAKERLERVEAVERRVLRLLDERMP